MRFSPFLTKALVDVITGVGAYDQREPIGIYRSGPMIEQFFPHRGLALTCVNVEIVRLSRHRVSGSR